jgi:hypothetical protein
MEKRTRQAGIDELYGLEPVFEPGAEAGPELSGSLEVTCPYCGEAFTTAIDLSAGSQTYIEDCQVCCQPIEMRLAVTAAGEFASLQAERIDR